MQQVPSPTRPLMKAAANRAADEGQLCTGTEGSAVRQYLLHQALPLYLQQYLQGLLCTIAGITRICGTLQTRGRVPQCPTKTKTDTGALEPKCPRKGITY